MGLCMSKSSARSTPGSEKSEKCRWDKHGNVFFPVRRAAHTGEEDGARQPRAFMNPVYNGFESPPRRGLSSISKFLKGSKGPPLQVRCHPLSPSRARCRDLDLLGEKANFSSVTAGEQPKRHGTLLKFIEAEKNGLSLSRSSSAKEGSLTRTSSTKEAALSRCSSQKEGKRDCAADSLRPSPDHLATIASLKAINFKLSAGHCADKSNEIKPVEEEPAAEKSREEVEETVSKKTSAEAPPSNLMTRGLGLGLPWSYQQPLVFRAVSPDKCRGRCTSTHSSLSSEELAAVTNRQRRRSPGRKSRSPRKCSRSPNKRTGGSNFALNPSAARFQKSLPGARADNGNAVKPPQAPKDVTAKENGRSALRELQLNSLKPQHFRRHSSPVKNVHLTSGDYLHTIGAATKPRTSVSKSEKFSVYSDAIHVDIQSSSSFTTGESTKNVAVEENPSCLAKEPRSGSKRLRSPKKVTGAAYDGSTDNINLRLSVPRAALDAKFNENADVHTKDKHVDIASTTGAVEDKLILCENEDEQDSGTCSPHRGLLELLERTPKKLKKMALKLALLIELENSADEDGQEDDGVKRDVDLELKLGMASEKSRKPNGDGVRLDLSVAVDSPTRRGSTSVPGTPRPSITSTCNGLSVEARIGSSKHSDFSFHITKNPDQLFSKVPRFHISRTEHREESTTSSCTNSSVFPRDKSGNKVTVDLTASREENSDLRTHSTTEAMHSKSGTAPVQRCSSFGFENDDRKAKNVIVDEDKEETPSKGRGFRELDLNTDVWLEDDHSSPGFEFQVKSAGLKSLPATPVMPAAPKAAAVADALSLSADEIAEIWGAFEAGQETCS